MRKVYTTPNSFPFPRNRISSFDSNTHVFGKARCLHVLHTVLSPSREREALRATDSSARVRFVRSFHPLRPSLPSVSHRSRTHTNLIYTEFPARAPAFHAWMPISDIADARLNLWHRMDDYRRSINPLNPSDQNTITLELSFPAISMRAGQYPMYRVVKDLVVYRWLKPVILWPVISF